jgi:hypothetical protein
VKHAAEIGVPDQEVVDEQLPAEDWLGVCD